MHLLEPGAEVFDPHRWPRPLPLVEEFAERALVEIALGGQPFGLIAHLQVMIDPEPLFRLPKLSLFQQLAFFRRREPGGGHPLAWSVRTAQRITAFIAGEAWIRRRNDDRRGFRIALHPGSQTTVEQLGIVGRLPA
ncbi:MAG: hypothetical protein COT06_00750 [Syntrophobacteraceae bacterium CG07_land_8_20_14_0_80_61_8]|nr:MAG: hypothetical protein COT06_00750 [Syntrophobacteraceae bacterium CG07_land_8_20_14_0_80_61_8]